MTTSKELVIAALRGEEVDRVPFYPPFQGYWALADAGVTTRGSIDDPGLAASAQLKVVKPCHMDAVEMLWDWLFPVEALGCQVKVPEYGTIGTRTHIVKEAGDIDMLELPELDHFYRYRAARESAGILSDRLGKEHYLTASVPGLFTLAGVLRGMEDLLFDTLASPDWVDALLGKATELSREVLEHVCSWDVDAVQVCDPTTSGDMMGPDDFDRFSKDHLNELGKGVGKSGKDFVVHMCGNTDDRLDRIAETGCVAFSCGTKVDIRRAVESMRVRMSIIGNIDPTGVLFSGDPDRVRSEALRILEAGGKRGFLLGAGCDIPVGAPLENVRAM